MDAYSSLHFDELEKVHCSAGQCFNISVSTASLFLFILSPVDNCDKSQNSTIVKDVVLMSGLRKSERGLFLTQQNILVQV